MWRPSRMCFLVVLLYALASVGSAAEDIPTVAVTMTDIRFRAVFENMIMMSWKFLGTRPFVVPLDAETAAFFEARGVDTLPLPRPFGDHLATFGKSPRRDLLVYDLVLSLLQRQVRVVYFDMDVFWRHPVLEYDDPGADLMVLGQAFDEVVNNGFFIAKPTVRCEVLFTTLIDWVTAVATETQRSATTSTASPWTTHSEGSWAWRRRPGPATPAA
mmetsp:Transcript_141557/g.452146  ORF Transcript_141557/g.452146 Transcript_141557/m.452146 type:complete len:215 (-) Transcript_141557:730-1374(-)